MQLLNDLLAAAVEVLTPDPDDGDDPRTPPPDRRYLAHGPDAFAWDCELLAVHLLGIRLESDDPAGVSRACVAMPVIDLAVTLLRCYPKAGDAGGIIPSAEDITAAAEVLAVDAAALAGGVADMWADGTLFPTAGVGCGKVTLSPGVTALGPEGGYAGWRLTLAVRP